MEEKIYRPQKCAFKELNHKSGIYQIRNLVNGKLYIGSAENLQRRKCTHLNELRNSKHHSNRLQNAFNKYGEENFIFEVIEFCEDKNKLIEHEQYWIDRFETYNKEKGYNICDKAGKPKNLKGYKFSEEHNKKISEAKTGIKLSEEHKNNVSLGRTGKYTGDDNFKSIAVYCLETGTRYSSIEIAKKTIGVPKCNIAGCCANYSYNQVKYSRRSYTAGGYHWMYEEDYLKATIEEIQEILSFKQYCQPKLRIKIKCKENGKIFESIIEASKWAGVCVSAISQVLDKENRTSAKYHWISIK